MNFQKVTLLAPRKVTGLCELADFDRIFGLAKAGETLRINVFFFFSESSLKKVTITPRSVA